MPLFKEKLKIQVKERYNHLLYVCRPHSRERIMLFQVIKGSFQVFRTKQLLARDTLRGPERHSRRKILMRSIKLFLQLGKACLMMTLIRFNAKRIPQHDLNLHAFSRRYGKETLMDTAPNYKHGEVTTNFRMTI